MMSLRDASSLWLFVLKVEIAEEHTCDKSCVAKAALSFYSSIIPILVRARPGKDSVVGWIS